MRVCTGVEMALEAKCLSCGSGVLETGRNFSMRHILAPYLLRVPMATLQSLTRHKPLIKQDGAIEGVHALYKKDAKFKEQE